MMEKRFVGIEDLAKYLDLSVNTLYSWKCQRKIPCHKLGRLLKFDLKEIEEWLKDKRIKEKIY